MIPFNEAFQIVLNNNVTTSGEEVPLNEACGHVLFQDIRSDMDMPPFDKSAVDGFACRRQDIGNKLIIVETIAAGKAPITAVGENQCSKIMTGAMLPEGADCVLMIEDTQVICEKMVKFLRETTANNICYRAEDVKKGTLVLPKGTLLGPEHIAVLASMGCHTPQVSRKPKVGIISTGDELVEPSEIPHISQIRNSNSWQLLAQVQQMNAVANYAGIAKDNEEATLNKIQEALEQNDVVLLTGGVSMGDFDMVPDMMTKAGIEILFRSIAIQPGKPTVFGRKGNKFCFGLPGNPVSSYVLFELMVKPMLYQMMGHNFKPLTCKMPFTKEYNRRRSDRLSVLPIIVNADGTVEPIDYHGSAHIHSLTFARGFAFISLGQTTVRKGEMIDVRFL
jgi:molybdopterin molybdotransferase